MWLEIDQSHLKSKFTGFDNSNETELINYFKNFQKSQ